MSKVAVFSSPLLHITNLNLSIILWYEVESESQRLIHEILPYLNSYWQEAENGYKKSGVSTVLLSTQLHRGLASPMSKLLHLCFLAAWSCHHWIGLNKLSSLIFNSIPEFDQSHMCCVMVPGAGLILPREKEAKEASEVESKKLCSTHEERKKPSSPHEQEIRRTQKAAREWGRGLHCSII